MTLSKGGQGPSYPPDVWQAMRALAIDRVAAEVYSALDTAGVAAILLKGSSVRQWLYPRGGRSYCDTDVLVPDLSSLEPRPCCRDLASSPGARVGLTSSVLSRRTPWHESTETGTGSVSICTET